MTVLHTDKKPGEMVLSVRLPAGGTVNWSPMLVTGAYNELLSREPYWTGLERTAILTEDFQISVKFCLHSYLHCVIIIRHENCDRSIRRRF